MVRRSALRLVVGVAATAAVFAMSAQAVWAAPGLTLSTSTASPTITVTVAGSGFTAFEGVDIFFDTTDAALVGTDASGSFSGVAVKVPANAQPGKHWLSAEGRADHLFIQKPFTVHTPWMQRGFNSYHRGVNPYENVLSPSSVGSLDPLWMASLGAGVNFGGPVVTVSGLVIAGSDSSLEAFNQSTGALAWSHTAIPAIQSTPAVYNGLVFVHSQGGQLYAYNTSTGALVWQAATNDAGSAFSSPTVYNGVVYVGSNDGHVYAFATNCASGGATCSPTATFAASGPVLSSPAVSPADGEIFATANSSPAGLDAWPLSCAGCSARSFSSGASLSSPAVSNGVVYFGQESPGFLFALPTINFGSTALWSGNLGSAANVNSPSVANGVVYSASYMGGQLSAFAVGCGQGGAQCSPLWTVNPGFQLLTQPAVAGGLVFVATINNPDFPEQSALDAYAAGPSCGSCGPLWTTPLGAPSSSPPAISDGMVFVTDHNGILHAYSIGAGSGTIAHRPPQAKLLPDYTLPMQLP
jgi:outer membrane protein assembly factor BamB